MTDSWRRESVQINAICSPLPKFAHAISMNAWAEGAKWLIFNRPEQAANMPRYKPTHLQPVT